jgi:hypothetical protein
MGKLVSQNTINIRPGWIVADCSRASGGIRYDREMIREKPINHGVGLQADHKTRKTVDHVEFCAAIDAIVKKVDYVLRKHCARTSAGWFADDRALVRVKAEVAQIEDEADALNTRALKAHSARQAYIRVWPLHIELAHPEAVQEIARTVRTVLTEIRDALRAGELKDLHKLRIRSKNLHQLATGFQSDAIRFALERVPQAARELRDAVKVVKVAAKDDPKMDAALAAACKRAGKQLDLEAIEAAIAHFENSPLSQGDFDPLAQVAEG